MFQRSYNILYLAGKTIFVICLAFDRSDIYLYSFIVFYLLMVVNDLLQMNFLKKLSHVQISPYFKVAHLICNLIFGANIFLIYQLNLLKSLPH